MKIHTTNTLERLNKEVKRRADVVGIFPNEDCIMRLLGAVLTELNEEWLLQNRYLPPHSMAEIDQAAEKEVIDALPVSALQLITGPEGYTTLTDSTRRLWLSGPSYSSIMFISRLVINLMWVEVSGDSWGPIQGQSKQRVD